MSSHVDLIIPVEDKESDDDIVMTHVPPSIQKKNSCQF